MVHKIHGAYIAAVVVPVLVVSLLLFCCCIGCCSDRSEPKKDIENNPAKYKASPSKTPTPLTSPPTTILPNNVSSISPPLLVPQMTTTPAPPRTNSITYRPHPPPVNTNPTSTYRLLEETRDSLDLPRTGDYWHTRRPPTPPQDRPRPSSTSPTSTISSHDFPEFRSLRQFIPVPPPTAVVADNPQNNEVPLLTSYDGSRLGMHDEGPSRKATPHFTVPVTRPQTAASNHRSSSTVVGETPDSIPLTEISRSGTRSFTPKVQAKKRVEISDTRAIKKSKSKSKSGKARSKRVVEEPPPSERELILNDEGLTPAQIARNLPRKGFTPKVAATVKVEDEIS